MRSIIVLAAALAAIASPAAAEFGKRASPSGFQKVEPAMNSSPAASPYRSHYGAPAASASKPKTYGAPPAAEPFKPYEPYKSRPGTSLFGPGGKPKR